MIDPNLKARISSGEVNKLPACERYQFYLEAARAGYQVQIILFRDALGQMQEVATFAEPTADTEVKQ